MSCARESIGSQSIDGPWTSASSYTQEVFTTNVRRLPLPLTQGQRSQQEWRTKQLTKARRRSETCTTIDDIRCFRDEQCTRKCSSTSSANPSTSQGQVEYPRLTRLGFTVGNEHVHNQVLSSAANTPAHASVVISQPVWTSLVIAEVRRWMDT